MIWCIGVGPGDLGYLTQRGKDLIETADVIAGFTAVVDLVRPRIRPGCRVVNVGYKDQVEKLRVVAGLKDGVRYGDHLHPGRGRRADAVLRVLDRRAARRIRPQPSRRLEVDVGCRLTALDLL